MAKDSQQYKKKALSAMIELLRNRSNVKQGVSYNELWRTAAMQYGFSNKLVDEFLLICNDFISKDLHTGEFFIKGTKKEDSKKEDLVQEPKIIKVNSVKNSEFTKEELAIIDDISKQE